MDYIKKLCFLTGGEGFSTDGKMVKGVCKITTIGNETKAEVDILNLAKTTSGKYYLAFFQKDIFIFENYQELILNDFDITKPFCVSLIWKDVESKIILFGKTQDFNMDENKLKNAFNEHIDQLNREKRDEDEQIEKAVEEYFDDTVATENYYENVDVDLQNLSIKEGNSNTYNTQKERFIYSEMENNPPISEPYQKPKIEEPKTNETQKIKTAFTVENEQEIDNLLNNYPPFEELNKAIYGSKWVVVSVENGEYYFGKAKIVDTEYLCYAVRGKEDECPKELQGISNFIPSSPFNENQGFFVLLQDTTTGKLVKK